MSAFIGEALQKGETGARALRSSKIFCAFESFEAGCLWQAEGRCVCVRQGKEKRF